MSVTTKASALPRRVPLLWQTRTNSCSNDNERRSLEYHLCCGHRL
jgi:hypothetical protein